MCTEKGGGSSQRLKLVQLLKPNISALSTGELFFPDDIYFFFFTFFQLLFNDTERPLPFASISTRCFSVYFRIWLFIIFYFFGSSHVVFLFHVLWYIDCSFSHWSFASYFTFFFLFLYIYFLPNCRIQSMICFGFETIMFIFSLFLKLSNLSKPTFHRSHHSKRRKKIIKM